MTNPESFGRYKVEGILGRGGMGLVYKAIDPVIGREVAIKSILAGPQLSEEEVAELHRRLAIEYRVAGTLAHPNIVTIFDVGEEGQSWFIAMEVISGPALDDVMKRETRMEDAKIASYTKQLASALDYAHDAGIIHRDIKPSNILITADDRPKLADFGIAKVAQEEATRSGEIIGTPWYMAPEQVLGETVSGATDQFALAIMSYEMLVGQRPFKGDKPTSVLYQIVHGTPTKPSVVQAHLPQEVSDVLLRALSKKPADRFACCTDFAIALDYALRGEEAPDPIERRARSRSLPPEVQEAPTVRSQAEDPKRPRTQTLAMKKLGRSWRLATILMVIAVIAAVGILGKQLIAESEGGSSPEILVVRKDAKPVKQSLEIVTDHRGAAIWIDGVDSGKVAPDTVELNGVEGEKLYLSLRRGELMIAETHFVLGEDERAKWAPALEAPPTAKPVRRRPTPAPAAGANGDETEEQPEIDATSTRIALLESYPNDVRVMLDGELVAESTPVEIEVIVGSVLSVERDGYDSWSHAISESEVEGGIEAEALVLQALLYPDAPQGVVDESLKTVRAPADVDTPGELYAPAPPYPAELLSSGLSGVGIWEVTLDPHGRVAKVKLLRGVEDEVDGHARRAILARRYQPSGFKGKAVNVILSVTMHFPPNR